MPSPTYLSAQDHLRISNAVAQAELLSSGEIVTILAERSDGYTDIQLAWSAAASLLALCALVIAPDFYLGLYDRLFADWGHEWTSRAIISLTAVIAALKFGGAFLVQFWQPLKFWLIPPQVKTARVHDRAIRAFRIGAERRTAGRTGVLIYLSMREHRAEIVADEAIAAMVPPEVWGDAMAAMLAHMGDDRIAEGICAAVERVGTIIAPHFPRSDDDANEIPDRLIEV